MTRLPARLAALLAGCVVVASEGPAALACSADLPRPEAIVFRPDGRGVTALVAPDGTVVRLGFEGGGWALWSLSGRFADRSAALSADGSTVVFLDGYVDGEGSGSCAVDRVVVSATGLRSGRALDVGQIGASPTYLDYAPALSPSGLRVAVAVTDLAAGDDRLEIFEVSRGARERAVLGSALHWVDDDLFVVRRGDLDLVAMRASDGEVLGQLLGDGASGPIGQLRTDPSRRTVTLVDGGATLVTASLDAGAVRLERRELARPLWAGEVDPDLVDWSDDYSTVVRRSRQEGRLPVLEVTEAATGRVLSRVSGQAWYSAVRLSQDGRALALVSHEPILVDGLGDTDLDSPPTLELVDLNTGRIVSWGARQRTEVVRP